MSGLKPTRQKSRSEQLRKEREQANQPVPHRSVTPTGASQLRRVTPGKLSQNRRQYHSTAAAPAPVRIFSRSQPTQPNQPAGINLPKMPVFNRTRGNVRKKVSIPLKQRGSELIFPAMPILKAGSRWVSGILAILLAALLFAYYVDPQFKASAIQFEGLQRISSGDVQQVLDLDDTPIFAINPAQVKADLSRYYPELIDPQIRIGIPGNIQIQTSERQPIIEWLYNDFPLWIDQEGFIFLPRGEIDRSSLMIINADTAPPPAPPAPLSEEEIINLPTPTATPESFVAEAYQPVVLENYFYVDHAIITAAIKLSASIPAGTGLVYSAENGIGWSDPQGWNVYVGLTLDDLDTKLTAYQAIVNKLVELGINPTMISVEHLSAPFYRN